MILTNGNNNDPDDCPTAQFVSACRNNEAVLFYLQQGDAEAASRRLKRSLRELRSCVKQHVPSNEDNEPRRKMRRISQEEEPQGAIAQCRAVSTTIAEKNDDCDNNWLSPYLHAFVLERMGSPTARFSLEQEEQSSAVVFFNLGLAFHASALKNNQASTDWSAADTVLLEKALHMYKSAIASVTLGPRRGDARSLTDGGFYEVFLAALLNLGHVYTLLQRTEEARACLASLHDKMASPASHALLSARARRFFVAASLCAQLEGQPRDMAAAA